jgi:hypothetical protein
VFGFSFFRIFSVFHGAPPSGWDVKFEGCNCSSEGKKHGGNIRSAMNLKAVESRLWPNVDISLCLGAFLTLFAMFFMRRWGNHNEMHATDQLKISKAIGSGQGFSVRE